MFLVETDTEMVKEEKDYKINKYTTILPTQSETQQIKNNRIGERRNG